MKVGSRQDPEPEGVLGPDEPGEIIFQAQVVDVGVPVVVSFNVCVQEIIVSGSQQGQVGKEPVGE